MLFSMNETKDKIDSIDSIDNVVAKSTLFIIELLKIYFKKRCCRRQSCKISLEILIDIFKT